MRTTYTGAALLAMVALLAACSNGSDEGASPDVPVGPSTPSQLTESELDAFEATAQLKLPKTDNRVIWSGTVSPGTSSEIPDGVQSGSYVLDLVCVGEGESYIEFTVGDTGVTTSVPCSTPGQLTTRPLDTKSTGKLKVSGGVGSGVGGNQASVLVARLTKA